MLNKWLTLLALIEHRCIWEVPIHVDFLREAKYAWRSATARDDPRWLRNELIPTQHDLIATHREARKRPEARNGIHGRTL